MSPRASATNFFVEVEGAARFDELLSRVGEGLYIGRIWYTYPVNGLGPGDFTATVVADSYLIEDGRLIRPLAPNTLRLNDNIKRILMSVTGASDRVRGTIVWAADEIVYAPDLAVADVRVDEIARTEEPVGAHESTARHG